jgi:hypothetical protein
MVVHAPQLLGHARQGLHQGRIARVEVIHPVGVGKVCG